MVFKNKSFLSNYLSTYLWQGISMVLGFLSMLIVIPLITDDKIIYGIYSICIATAMFLNYVDLGFVSAGIKYAGESYAKGKVNDEIKFYGFSGFILFVFISIIAAVYLLFSLNPSILINDIDDMEHLSIASSLLLIQAIFSFNTVLQRYVSGVFQVRIKEYVFQKINIVGSIVKISSVFYFFSAGNYDIIGYFLFAKIVELLTIIVGINIISIKYKLFFSDYLKALRFDKKVFNKSKHLAFGSLFTTFMWILYYELDIIVIGKLLGASAVAVYSISFLLMNFLRSLSSVIFSPFQNRYNHFVGLNDINGLKVLLYKVILFSMPILVIPIFTIVFLSDNIIITWVGKEYLESSIILTLLAINFMYGFLRQPGANMLVTLVRIKEMYWVNAVVTLVFWGGVLLTKDYLGLNSFAIFKLLSGTLIMLFYFNFLVKFLNKKYFEFFKDTICRIIFPIIIMTVFLFLIKDFLPETKGTVNLVIIIFSGGIASIIGFICLYFSSSYYKNEFNHYALKILNKK